MLYIRLSMQLSLCIPTINRWSFLSVNIPKYLENPYIHEIVITDENGNDAKKIRETFDDPRIKVYVNDYMLGPFLNKRRAVSLATNELICLMDSDNFAPVSYFEAFYKFLDRNPYDVNAIYSPSYTIPQDNHPGFDFRMFLNVTIDKTNYKPEYAKNEVIFNVGNYISSKALHQKLVLTADETKRAKDSFAADVVYSNYLLLTRADAKIITVPDMAYDHVVHAGSIYELTRSFTDIPYFHSFYK